MTSVVDARAYLPELTERNLLPEGTQAAYASGSIVRGWGNDRSDLDIYVVMKDLGTTPGQHLHPVALKAAAITVEVFHVGSRRWDVEYWRESQVDEVFSKISTDQLRGDQAAGSQMSSPEIAFLQRLRHAAPIVGEDWVRARQRQLDASAVNTIMALRALGMVDIFTEDAVGQLAAHDDDSAVLSAKLAFRYAIDALLCTYGEFGNSPKWFARRFRAAQPSELSFADYWAVETMQTFDPQQPRRWVEEVLRICQDLTSEVTV